MLQTAHGIRIERYFTQPKSDPCDLVEWETRAARILDVEGKVVFELTDAEFPVAWSQNATNVVASKYFRVPLGTTERERSVRHMIRRVAGTIASWGRKDGYFTTSDDAEAFEAELSHLLLHQMAAFNSPVWFNVGVHERPQCSACFILSIQDSMESILEWIRKEGMIFKGGSGSGVNLSPLRSSSELLSKGGTASGPVSFMRGADASAGAIKSGGTTRRAAKMVVLNVDHPDIEDFVWCKAREEQKAWALGERGYDMSLNGEAWTSIQFQNANNSVRATEEFMRAVLEDREWRTRAVTTGEVMRTYRARDLMRAIAEAAHICGDPGMQYDTTINDWHTCPRTGRINASNPCSEYMHLDDSACNLASLNLLKFVDPQGEFEAEGFRRAVDTMILAQEIIVDNSSYPSEEIAKNARAFRQLGLGYANLGALLMSRGLPYDSDSGRAYAAAITALMTGEAYAMSARVAAVCGPFAGYEVNREPMLRVIGKHRAAAPAIPASLLPSDLLQAAVSAWDAAAALGEVHGYRNAQATVLAPTGTISFLMDCDTTGVEPDIALVKYKQLVGGGMMKIVNQTVPRALIRLGYSNAQVAETVASINDQGTIEGAPHIREDHLPVFDCAFRPLHGTRSLHHMAHVKMMAAVQPFISGAISKTVNLPHDATVEDVEQVYIEAWRRGLKALAIYRDGSKRTQPLSTGVTETQTAVVSSSGNTPEPVRRKLPSERRSLTHKFCVAGHEGYVTVGLYENGQPGEIFLTMSKEGSTISGLMDTVATLVSLALQYGVPLKALVDKFSHVRFEPAGITENREIPFAKSLVDYVFRWLGSRFLPLEERDALGLVSPAPEDTPAPPVGRAEEKAPSPVVTVHGNGHGHGVAVSFQMQADAPSCARCGNIMVRTGTCYRCLNCGETSGCS